MRRLCFISALVGLGLCANCGDNNGRATPDLAPTEDMASPPSDMTTGTSSETIVDIAASDPEFSILVAALNKTGLASTLSGPGPFTVFAPTNDAFAALKAAGIDASALDVNMLTAVLKNHVVGSKLLATMVAASSPLSTLDGSTVKVSMRDGGVYLNGLTLITKTDIKASNGVLHVIDSVLLPDTSLLDLVGISTAYPALSSLKNAVVAANLASTLTATGPFTLFAPTNVAFAKLASPPEAGQLPDILKYHAIPGKVDSTAAIAVAQMNPPGNQAETLLTGKKVTLTLSGQTLKVNASAVTYTDIQAKNGVIHLIDTVLTPE
jgi:uncharacterized surface protein with fasciclin (FAS1) repeats